MSSIANLAPTRAMTVGRTAPAPTVEAPAVAAAPLQLAPQPAPPPVRAAQAETHDDGVTAIKARGVQRVVQQIAASAMYGAHVSVVSNGGGVRVTIDVSA